MSRKIFFIFLFPTLFLTVHAFGGDGSSDFDGFQKTKKVYIQDGSFETKVYSNAQSVSDFVKEQNITLKEKDEIYPVKDVHLYSGSRVIIKRAKKINVLSDDDIITKYTFENQVGAALKDFGIELKKEDIVKPQRKSFVYSDMDVEITRVEIKEEKETQAVDFETEMQKDDEMGWREEKVVQKGEDGEEEVIFKVVYHNGEEISREKTGVKITKKPINKIIKRGTYVKYGKKHTGLGTWYGQPDHLKAAYPSITGYYAANPWLPKGSYVKVTNKANGKSVIVRINDRGPFGENRIIDLSKGAFAQIASLGAGVLDVKVEEILN